MLTIHQPAVRDSVLRRFGKLKPDTKPKWGQLDAPGMVTHVTDTMRSGLGELKLEPKGGPLQRWPFNTLVMFYLPWPKGVPTSPELIARKPGELEAEIVTLRTVLDRFGTRDIRGSWPPHAAFGQISGEQWGRLMYRHLDHHLGQFGL